MIVIRRLVDRHRSYTGIFLPGEEARIFPTSDYEHARILQIYKQDRPHEGIINDFTDLYLAPPSAAVKPVAVSHKKSQPGTDAKKRKPAAAKPRRGEV
jgi:hypothetical protein